VDIHDVRWKRHRKRYRPRRWVSRNWTQHKLTMGGWVLKLVSKRYWGVSAWSAIRGEECRLMWDDCDTYQEMTAMKKRPMSKENGSALHVAAVESDLFSKHLALVQHCSHTQYDDGTPRKPGWFTIKTMGSAWVVEVKDPDSCSRMTVVQQTLDDAIQMASLLLESEEAPWEADPWLKSNERKGKKN